MPSPEDPLAKDSERRLLIIRHAIAEDREEWAGTGRPDALRPLTPEGESRMARAAAGLRTLVPALDALGTSPLARAVRTAEIVAREYGRLRPAETPSLEPDAEPGAFAAWLAETGGGTVAAVGHEPHLSELVGWLLAGERRSVVELKKGAACLLALDRRPGPGSARLVWAIPPAQLRRLAEAPQ